MNNKVKLKEYIHPRMEILFLALNAPEVSNKNQHWFSNNLSFWNLLFDAELITEKISDPLTGDDKVFDDNQINYNGWIFGVTDLNRDIVQTSSKGISTNIEQVKRIIKILDTNEVKKLCIIHGNVAKEFDKARYIKSRSGSEREGYGIVGSYNDTVIFEVPFHNSSKINKHEIYSCLKIDIDKSKKYTDEIQQIINSRHSFIEKHYLQIRGSYQKQYKWQELDPIRHEICLCIMFGLCQSATTLTNHLLESLLKNALIINHAKNVKQSKEQIEGRVISSLEEKYREAINLFDDKDLNYNINRSCTLGLITKKQKEDLHDFRNRFRNAYRHASKNKIFGNSTIPVSGISMSDGKIKSDESKTVNVSGFLIGQGIIQWDMSQELAPQYFLYIDNLVYQIKKKIFPVE